MNKWVCCVCGGEFNQEDVVIILDSPDHVSAVCGECEQKSKEVLSRQISDMEKAGFGYLSEIVRTAVFDDKKYREKLLPLFLKNNPVRDFIYGDKMCKLNKKQMELLDEALNCGATCVEEIPNTLWEEITEWEFETLYSEANAYLREKE